MARKKKTPPTPPVTSQPPSSSSSEDSSSGEEDEFVTQPAAAAAPLAPTPTLKRKQPSASASASASDSDSDSDPPTTETVAAAAAAEKPTVDSSSSSEEDDEVTQGPKSPTKVPESETEKKKLKLSMKASSDQSLPSKSSSLFQRIWSEDDELVLLRTLSKYRAEHGKLPSEKECDILLSGIMDLVSFPVTERQIWNKVRTLRYNYGQRFQKGSDGNITNPHEMLVFKLCSELFEASRIVSKRKTSSKTTNGACIKIEKTTGNGSKTNGGAVGRDAAYGSKTNGGAVTGSYFYLGELIKDLTEKEQLPEWISTVDYLVENIGESMARDLDTKSKELRIDAIKLNAREKKLGGELLDLLANKMSGNEK